MNTERILNSQFVMTDNGRIDRVVDLYTTFNDKVDLEALKASGFIDAIGEMMEPVLGKFDDHAPEVVAYWAKRGMVKEFHGEDEPMCWEEYERKTGYGWRYPSKEIGSQNNFKKWNSFVPVSAFDPANKDKKYPAVVVLHGGFNPISIIDGWGYVQEAAKREWIVIVPSLELDEIIEEILIEAAKLYPIDESRIYATGFSYGGFMSNFLGNKRPDIFAAVGPCGAPISNAFVEKAIGPEPQSPFDGIPRAIAMNTYMPVINVYGDLDGFRFPIYNYTDPRSGEFAGDTVIEGINSWCRVNRAQEIDLAAALALKDADASPEEKHMGIPLAPECRHTVVADGVTNYIADFPSADGIVRTRVMCEVNIPHWPTPELSRQIFEFFSHFSRDRKTGESIYTA